MLRVGISRSFYVSYCRLCDRKGWYKSQLIVAMPQGYRAKDHVVIKTYSGSARPQSVFDWVGRNLASRVHRIRDTDKLHTDWYQFQRKSEKVSGSSVCSCSSGSSSSSSGSNST